MNTAAHELGQLAGALATQRAREPIRAMARRLCIEAGEPIPPAINPPLILSTSDQLSHRHAKEAQPWHAPQSLKPTK